MPFIEQQLAAALLPLVDDRAYPLALPQNTEYPAITFHRVDSREIEEDYALSPLKWRRARGMKSVFQVVVWSKTYSDCVALLRSCKNTLEAIKGLYLDGVSDGYEPELQLYTSVMEFAIWGDLENDQSPSTNNHGALTDVMAAIETTLSTQLPAIDVAQYEPQEGRLPLPAIRLDIRAIEHGQTCGDGRLAVRCTFVAWCCYSAMGYQATEAAAAVLDIVRYNHWTLGTRVSQPEAISAQPAEFTPGTVGIDAWTVSWKQTVYLPSVDALEEAEHAIPDQVMASHAPEIGADYENNYVEL